MSEDQQTYRRATSAAAVGLVVQIILTTVVGLLGLWAQSPAIYAATWYFAGGLPIWLILMMVYYQHQQEQAESLEAERLADRDTKTAAIFDEQADQLQMAQRRLANLYKWGLGIVSVVVAAYLLTMGGLQLFGARQLLAEGELIDKAVADGRSPLMLMGVTISVAFAAFIVARYLSGMTREPAWRLLRGGASWLMGNTLVSVLLLVGAVTLQVGNPAVLGWLSLLIPVIMLLIGVEVGMMFLLNAYRPRRPDEMPRPAFDSRVLGLLTTPESLAQAVGDAINYQFGFEVSRSWFYSLLSRAITPLCVAGLVVLFALSSLVIVAPYEQAIITFNGRVVPYSADQKAHPPGLHFKAPWPLGRAQKMPVGRLLQVTVGTPISPEGSQAILWTNQHHEGDVDYLLTAPTPSDEPAGSDSTEEAIGQKGSSLVAAQVVVQYRINDLHAYLNQANDPTQMLKDLAEAEVSRYFVTQDIDSLLGAGRIKAGDVLTERIKGRLNREQLGLDVVFVGIPGIHPPAGTGQEDVASPAAAFVEQIAARSERIATIEQARQEAIRTLASAAGSQRMAERIRGQIDQLNQLKQQLERARSSETPSMQQLQELREAIGVQELTVERLLADAGGEAAEKIYAARAYRWERAVEEAGKARRFKAQRLAYERSPKFYTAQRYLEVLAEGLAQPRKVIVATEHVEAPTWRIDLKDASTGINRLIESAED
ncbi:MAG: SPFH domain-containing protein [Phycisphaeraceae bacterium]|nr:SPFH domain-containing protein [Phycisphaeraceae bacterium]